jgi:hypothetical protein
MSEVMDEGLKKILTENGLEEYIGIFEQNKLTTGDLLAEITEADYEKIGVVAMGDRKKLLKLFDKVKLLIDDKEKYTIVNTPEKEKNTHGSAIAVFIAIISVIAIFYFAYKKEPSYAPSSYNSNSSSVSSSPVSSKPKELDIAINFSNTQFLITNGESFALTDVKMKVNDKYVLNVYKIEAKGMYTVGMAQFVDSAGNRFNAFTMKPVKFYISAKEGWQYFANN